MANVFNNLKDAPGVIAKAAAQTLFDNMVFAQTIDKADASDFDGKNGYKAGDTIQTSIPARYVPQQTFDITSSIQDSVEEKAPLTLDIISTVGMEIDTFEFATEVELKNTIKRFVIPAAESIAQDVETRFLEKATDATYNSVGTAGSNAYTVADSLAGMTKLDENLAPRGDRHFLLNSAALANAVDARKGLFQSSEEIASQYKKGRMGTADGFDWYSNELITTHTNGNDVTGVAIDDTVLEGASTIHVDGVTTGTGTVKKGQIFTIADVFMVHPITKVATSVLQQFVVTADVTASGTSDADLEISPAIYAGSGGLQNVDALPADDAAIVFVGGASSALKQPLQYHRSAFKCVSVPLIQPVNAEFVAQETVGGITVAVIRDFDILKRRMVTRLDFLGGLSAVRPEWSVRNTN
jgi:hypothetical protein